MPARRKVSWAKFRVIMLTICALSILSALFYLLTGGTLLSAKTTLYGYIPDATGIAKSSPVRVDGIDVGKVREVSLTALDDPNRVVKVVMTVEADRLRSIPQDSFFQISADTLIGDKFVDITSGRMAAIVPGGGEIRYQPATDLMKSLDLSQFERQLRIMDGTLTDIEQGKGRVGEFISSTVLYEDVRQRLEALQKGLTRAVIATSDVGAALYSDEAHRSILASVRNVDEALARMQSGQGTAGQWLRDSGDYERLRAGITELRRQVADLRTGRSAGARLFTSDDVYVDLNRKVGEIIEVVDRFNTNPLLTTPDAYDRLAGVANQARDLIREFRSDPSKLVRLKVF